jgi:arsenate reductase-like glutaredoxin family protein
MSSTMMKYKGETIVDHTPKDPFLSPLQQFIKLNCKQCEYWKSKCRLDDQNGMKRMELCIRLYCNQPPSPDALSDMMAQIRKGSKKIQSVAESTLKDLNLADMEQACGGIP